MRACIIHRNYNMKWKINRLNINAKCSWCLTLCQNFQVFPKGSPLVPDISTEIAKLRENGTLQMLEDLWFKSPTTFASGDTSDSVNPLTVGDFGGLFLISGTFSALAFLLFFASVLYRNWHIMRNWRRLEFVKEYVSMIIFKSRRESNAIHPHPELNNL